MVVFNPSRQVGSISALWQQSVELARGKYAVEIAHAKDLTVTLDAIRAAVLAGELDAAIDSAATKLRAGFTRGIR